MAKLVVRPIDKGLQNDRLSFNIDNDSFPTLFNAYQWRGRVKRKRGTSFLNRLTKYFDSTSAPYIVGTAPATLTLSGGAGNLITGTWTSASAGTYSISTLAPNASIVPYTSGSYKVTIIDTTSSTTYVDDGAGNLTGGSGGTINYASGAFTIVGGGSHTVEAHFLYYPNLPVMGLEEFVETSSQFPGTIGFDPVNAYNILNTFPYNVYNVSYYKNPPSATYTSYVQKTNVTPLTWNGQDYQQFWTTNYQGAMWTTNGINVPFNSTNIGMQFAPSSSISYSANTTTTITVVIANCPLVIGDFVFFNEWTGTDGATLNWQSGYVTAVSGTFSSLTVTIKLPNATLVSSGSYTPGIIQYLTNRSDATLDCLRWYDGDPTDGSSTSPALTGHLGWVNFMPPISRSSLSINDVPPSVYYLVGARLIIPFKDRLLFLGPVIQNSSNSKFYLQDTIIYSQNGTPYYTCSFTGDVSSAATVFHPILTPTGQTATANAYFSDQTGYGGYISAGIDQPICTVNPNEDVLLVGFPNKQTRLTYTSDDFLPFNFFSINSELGSFAPFSSITVDRGAFSIGPKGIVITRQVGTSRIDLSIPDQIFQFQLNNNGIQRITSQRDFINEWIYFTYCANESPWLYPNQTLQYNYRDDSWAIFNESYTTYGTFYITQDATWATIGNRFPTWETWNEAWDSGATTIFQPDVIGGNQQGFIVFRDRGTAESNSLYISSISISSGIVTVSSPNHNLNNGDYITINSVIGISNINGAIFGVTEATTNTFVLTLSDGQAVPSGTYIGSGVIQRMYVPFIQTKQFPIAWDMARKTRIGNQQYLLSTTDNGQITLFIYLSMNDQSPYNFGPQVPSEDVINNSLVYSSTVFTCPESTNLGLTPANINLQMVTGSQQQQIWHRMNTSLVGDTVQIGFTLSDAQMRDTTFSNQFAEIELHAFILDVQPSQLLS